MKHALRLGSILVAILFLSGSARSQSTEWSVAFNGYSADGVRDLAIDPWNNSYVVGRMSSGNVGGSSVTMNGLDIFLAKIDPNGIVQWVANAGGGDPAGSNEADAGWAVEYDSITNGIYIAGTYEGTTFGNEAVFGPGIQVAGKGSFLAKYDTTGTCLWMRSSNSGLAHSITIHSNGDVYVSGHTGSSPTLPDHIFHGPPSITIPNGTFVAKYTSDGQMLWAKQVGEFAGGQLEAVGDKIILGGGTYYGMNATFLGQPIVHAASQDVAFLAAVDTSFSTIFWSEIIPANVLSGINDVKVTSEGKILMSGGYSDSLILPFDTLIGASGSNYDPFVLQVDTSGVIEWVMGLAVNSLSAIKVSPSSDGSFYMAFSFEGAFTIPGGNIIANSALDYAIVHCSGNDGTPIGAINVGPVEVSQIALQATTDGGVIGGTEFSGSIDLGNGHILSGSFDDAFIAKFKINVGIQSFGTSSGGKLHIYANPNNGLCTVELPKALQFTPNLVLTVYNNAGAEVQRLPLRATDDGVRLDITAQAKGSYHVEVSDGTQRYSGTIVFE